MARRWTAAGTLKAAKGFDASKSSSNCQYSKLCLLRITPKMRRSKQKLESDLKAE